MRKTIKVLRIIARLNIGGPAIHTILLTEGLEKGRFETILVTGMADRNEGNMFYFAEEKGVHPIIIPELSRELSLRNDIVAFWKIFCLIRDKKPDIIHTHTAKAGALGRLAGILYNLINTKDRCKLIHTFHGNTLRSYFGSIKTKIFIWIERILAFFTDKIITLSPTLRKELLNLKIGNPKKITVIPLGLEMAESLSGMFRSSDSILRVGIVGRLVQIKNHRMFINAAKLILSNYPPQFNGCKFIIIGDGELRKELERYAEELGIKENIEFCGWQLKFSQVYEQLDIVVLASLNEGTPLSLIEAMAAAKPTIATDVGGVKDLFIKTNDYGLKHSPKIRIYDNGILCNSGDVEGMAEGLKILLSNNGLREAMGHHGRVFVKDRFSKDRLIKDIELLYNSV